MILNENDKKKYMQYFKEVEGDDYDLVIRNQLQSTVRETSRLIGLLAGGFLVAGIDSPEYRYIRETGSEFLHELVRIARKMHAELQ